MTDYAEAIYAQFRDLGDVGDEVRFAIWPWLVREHGMDETTAKRTRTRAMRELRRDGRVERVNVRGAYVRILS